jgi:hypothetical protein
VNTETCPWCGLVPVDPIEGIDGSSYCDREHEVFQALLANALIRREES